MKNTIFIIVVFCLAALNHHSYAQDYTPFHMDNVRWLMQRVNPTVGSNDGFDYWEIYTLDDTIVNNKLYRKVVTKNLCSLVPDRDGILHDNNAFKRYEFVLGGIREENKKVYFLKFNQNPPWRLLQFYMHAFTPDEDYLIYDFDVMPGDTVRFKDLTFYSILNGDTTYFTRSYHMVIKQKSSIPIENHNYFVVKNSNTFVPQHETGYLYEGIGSSYGFFGAYDSYLTYLRCFEINGQPFFVGSICNPCAEYVSTADSEPPIELSVFPNPTSHTVQVVSHSNFNIQEVKILDPVGRLLGVCPGDGPSLDLDFSGFKAGLFYLQIIFEHGKVKVEKVVVE